MDFSLLAERRAEGPLCAIKASQGATASLSFGPKLSIREISGPQVCAKATARGQELGAELKQRAEEAIDKEHDRSIDMKYIPWSVLRALLGGLELMGSPPPPPVKTIPAGTRPQIRVRTFLFRAAAQRSETPASRLTTGRSTPIGRGVRTQYMDSVAHWLNFEDGKR